MSGTPPSSIVATETPPVIRSPASESIHNAFLESAIPQWLTDATGPRRAALKKQGQDLPGGYPQVSPEQRKAITVAATASFISQTALDKALSEFMDIDTFAEPLLVAALMQQCRVTLDVRKTFVRLMKPVEMGLLAIDISSFEVLKLPLLQAALHNFEEAECETDAFHESSGFLLQGATSDTFEPLATSLTVAQFTRLCRSLDIGAKYQDYLAGYFKTADGVLDQALQLKFIAAQKDALWAAAEWALHKEHIERADYEMIMSVIRGEVHPRLNGKSVWFQDLSLMKHRMTGCVLFSIGGSNHHLNELILYVPQDPEHPLKRYTYAQLCGELKRQFSASSSSSTAYHKFFSRFVAYADRAHYFSQFTEDSPNATFVQKAAPYLPLLKDLMKLTGTISVFTDINELPPVAGPEQVPIKDPYLAPDAMDRVGQRPWPENTDLWAYLFGRHCDQLFADAKSHAVPTANVDALARAKKLAGLLNIGMLLLGGVSMFVPVLGEIMMGVMVAQLLDEVFEGVTEWSEGDRKAAKAHLVDVAENLALLAVTAGAGKGLAKLTAVKAEPVIEGMEPVTLNNGQVRLRKPDLKTSGRDVELASQGKGNRLGFPLSGEGAAGTSGLNPSLASRVLDLYPEMTVQQVNGFILKQMRAGKTDAQIFSRLQTLSREWDELELTLDHWTAAGDGARAAAASAIKECWRNAPLVEENPNLGALSMFLDAELPVLKADFSHVLGLDVQGPGITPIAINELLERCPEVQSLSLMGGVMRNVPRALSQMHRLTRLTLQLVIPSTDFSSRLRALGNLEELNLSIQGLIEDESKLDLAQMSKLRALTIDAPQLKNWPTGLLELPDLERLDLKKTAIKILPADLFRGHEQLLRGLSLDWGKFSESGLTSVYESIKSSSGVDLLRESIGREYCQRVLPRLGPWKTRDLFLLYENLGQLRWAATEAVESLSKKYDELTRQLDEWSAGRAEERAARMQMARALKHFWGKDVLKQFGVPVTDSIISGLEGRLSELPLLSGHTFSSVRILSLSDLRVPAEQIRGFVRAFPDATEVSLRGCGFTEFLLTPNDLPALEILALQDNPLKTVDVRGMNNLKALMLGATELSEWPMGVEDMPNLTCLDLRNSSLATLPEAFLARDELVLNTHLGGTPLTRQTRADLKVARQRVERAHILPAGALERLAAEEVPSPLQPLRVGPRLSKGLWTLPPAEILEGEGALSLEARLQRLLPGFTEDSARRWLVATSAKGLTRLDIHELINGWNQELETLTRELNGWLLNRYSQVKQINDLRKAGFQIIARWREGTVAPDVDRALDLSGMKLGVMPELSLQLPGVTTLDLSGMEVSTPGCEAFLRSFGNVRTLRLSNNPLNVLPSALSSMERLERLELSGAELGESAPVSEMLHHLKHLKWLDLSENRLGWDFDLTGFEALETLDMSHNCLHVWPKGIFESKTLKTLNLAKNQFEYLPPALFEGRHGELVKGINISGNPIQISDLRKIRDNFPAQAHSRPRFTGRYLGYTADEITQEIKDNRNSSDEDSDASLSN